MQCIFFNGSSIVGRDQFQTPANKDYDLQHVKEELADVMVYCRNLLDKLDLDEDEIINMKMTMNEAKYPVEKAKGSNTTGQGTLRLKP